MEKLCSQVVEHCKARVEVVPFRSFNHEFVNTELADFDATILSGTEALFSKQSDRAQFSGMIEAIKEIRLPSLGICGGEQLIALAFGKPIVPVGRLIRWYRNIEVIEDDALFEGLPRTISVMQSHYEIVKSLPASFRLLARSKSTSVEAFRSSDTQLYGVQFHPEYNDYAHPAGAKMLANFRRLLKH